MAGCWRGTDLGRLGARLGSRAWCCGGLTWTRSYRLEIGELDGARRHGLIPTVFLDLAHKGCVRSAASEADELDLVLLLGSSSSESSATSLSGCMRLGVRVLRASLRSSSSLPSWLLEVRRRWGVPRWLRRGVEGARDDLDPGVRAGEGRTLRERVGDGETGSRGREASARLDGPGVAMSASPELGGVGRPPGAFKLACDEG